MRTITQAQADLVDAVVAEKDVGGLTAAILEKDIHVTEALQTLFAIRHPHIQFVFCGGTSLSKGHGVIERMSEDLDIKVILADAHEMSRTGVRKHLKDLKALVDTAMHDSGFEQNRSGSVTRNEYRYFATDWRYQPRYENDTSLRAHLKLEFTIRTPAYPVQPAPIVALVDKFAQLPAMPIELDCVAVEETLAEKVLSFLRRHAQHRSGNMERDGDEALVRHIYDTYCIVKTDPEYIEKAKSHFGTLVAFDVGEFTQHGDFCRNPKACLTATIDLARTENQTQTEYQKKLLPLIYGNIKPSFADAFLVFEDTSRALLSTL